jgi:hypothetical protein
MLHSSCVAIVALCCLRVLQQTVCLVTALLLLPASSNSSWGRRQLDGVGGHGEG